MRLVASLLCLAVVASAYHEKFDGGWESRWVHSDDAKYAGNKLVVETPEGGSDPALKIPEKARHYGISVALPEPVDPAKGLVLQYELKLPSAGLTCGGAYLKFVTADPGFSPAGLVDSTPYTIMFGPDKCGSTNKVHLILRHKSPKTGDIEEKHLKTPPVFPNDDLTHVYTVELSPSDNTYRMLIDGVEKKAGALADDFLPPFNPPETIADPEDVKPEDWVDEATIPDPDAVKPEDWDEDAPLQIPDEDAVKPEGWLDSEPAEIEDPAAHQPEDWDAEEDGDWEAPLIPNPACSVGCGEWKRPTKPNPAYKGKWTRPQVANPAYKGPWKPRDIPNPAHFVDAAPLSHVGSIGGVALEVWTMDSDYYFSNVVVSNDAAEAAAVRDATWAPKHAAEAAAAEAKFKAEAAKKKAAGDDEDEDDEGPVERLLAAVFDSPLLAPHAARLAPVRRYTEENPQLVLGGVAGLTLALLAPLLKALVGGGGGRKPAAPSVAQVKKADLPTKDDDEEEEEEEEAKEVVEEIEEEEEEEEEKTTTRRRARRD